MGNSKPDLLKAVGQEQFYLKVQSQPNLKKLKLTSDDKKKNTHSTFHDLFGNKRKARAIAREAAKKYFTKKSE